MYGSYSPSAPSVEYSYRSIERSASCRDILVFGYYDNVNLTSDSTTTFAVVQYSHSTKLSYYYMISVLKFWTKLLNLSNFDFSAAKHK